MVDRGVRGSGIVGWRNMLTKEFCRITFIQSFNSI